MMALLLALVVLPPRGTENDHGGWNRSTSPRADIESLACDCRRVRLDELRKVPDEPVIVEGVTAGWPAARRWRRADLLRLHGDVEISVATTAEVTAFGDNLGARRSLRDFVESFDRRGENTDLFAFDTSTSLLHGHNGGYETMPPGNAVSPGTPTGGLAEDFITPGIFKEFLRDAEIGWNMLSLGGADQGLQFHTHGASWLALVYGAKEWWIYPSGAFPADVAATMMPLHPAKAWVPPMLESQRSREQLGTDDRLLHCVQQEGEALFIPAGFAHATRNLHPSIGVGGQAIWSAEDRLKLASGSSSSGGIPSAVLSWLGANSGGASQDYFVHVNSGLAAALQGNHAIAAAQYQLALQLCNSSVELHVKLFEEQLALLAEATAKSRGDPTITELRNAAAAAVNAGVDATLAAVKEGALERTGAAFMYRLGSAMVDAATKHTPPRWEPRVAFGVGEQVLAKAADLARAESTPSLLAGEIALVRGTIAASTENWPNALLQLQLAAQHLSDEWIENKLGRGPDELLDMVRQKAGRRSNADFPPTGGVAATKLNNEKKTKGTKKQKKHSKKKSSRSSRHAE